MLSSLEIKSGNPQHHISISISMKERTTNKIQFITPGKFSDGEKYQRQHRYSNDRLEHLIWKLNWGQFEEQTFQLWVIWSALLPVVRDM